MELQYNPFFVMLLGMGTVFVGLVALIYITKAMGALYHRLRHDKPVTQAYPEATAPAVAPQGAIANRPQFVAAVSAAIASYMGTEPGGLRIHSIRPAGGDASADHGRFVAAVAAAVATDMGNDVSGIRIHSIKRV